MRYSLHIHVKGTPHFLQRGHSLEVVQRDRYTIQRWVSEMGVEIPNPQQAKLVIYQDGEPTLQLAMSAIKRVWKPFTP